jgi:serine/threonine protein kinase
VVHLVWFAEFGRKVGSPRGSAHVAEGAFLMGVYRAPEAGNAKRPTQKSDVYSFGVVLLELLTGRSPFKQLAGGELDLVSWMRMGLQGKRALSEIFDPYLLKANSQQNKMIETLQVHWLNANSEQNKMIETLQVHWLKANSEQNKMMESFQVHWLLVL